MFKILATLFTLVAASANAEDANSPASVNPTVPHPEVTAQMPVPAISPNAAADFVKSQRAIIVDVREQSEAALASIPGAINIPLSQLKKRLVELDKYKQSPIITQCRTGRRSQEALNVLTSSGFTDVQSLEGGIVAWEKAGLKIDKKCC